MLAYLILYIESNKRILIHLDKYKNNSNKMDNIERIYNTKFIQSGDRLEIYKYRGYVRTGGGSRNTEGRRGKKDIPEEEKEKNRLISRSRNLNNAKNNIVRIVNCNKDLISFITITYKENMQDLRKSKKQVGLFFQKLKRDFQDLKYVYVLEYQERGAIHYHILTNFPVPIKSKRGRKTEEQKELADIKNQLNQNDKE